MDDPEPQALVVPPDQILAQFEDVNVAAPMVRYSKLPFRELVAQYDAHITHTPMMLAAEFSRSASARAADFTTSVRERSVFSLVERHAKSQAPIRVRGALVAQFAASDERTFGDACELIRPYVDGIDLNCGCPQPWAYAEHVGSWLLREPDRVRDLVRAAKARVGEQAFPISIKIRVDSDLRRTQQLVETAIHAGASHITVHGRTRHQASTVPVSLPSIAFAAECAKGAVPVVANGDCWNLADAQRIRAETRVQGVMAARGLLANPALFCGHACAPDAAIERFMHLAIGYGLQFGLIHRHIAFMLESRLSRPGMKYLNSLVSTAGLLDFLEDYGIMGVGEHAPPL
ncbi:FMN-linked oxidoreductase [Auricularia subglabra TFB-10046 SS5]|nr:FMN-linked oxidoreductase [Auricularia subglabra TFB-10046 SS5]